MRSIHVSPESAEAPRLGPAVLSLERVSIAYGPLGTAPVVRELSLELREGECLGVVGESGAGKSQTFFAVMGLLPANARLSGSIRLGDTELVGLPRRLWSEVRGTRLAMVFQDPASALTPHLTIGEQIAETLIVYRRMTRRGARARALALLERVQVTDAARRLGQFPHELSGGMRQRALIAMALACDPSVLIADEPTTALDVTIQAQILALLGELQRERRMAIVLITHDLGVIAGLADRVAVMQAGRVVELAESERLFSAPAHAHTRALLAATHANESERTAVSSRVAPALVALRALSVAYRLRGLGRAARLTAVDSVSLELASGASLGIVGESGSGKSTLLRALLQLVRPSAGEVLWQGTPLGGYSAARLRALRRDLQSVFQDPPGSLDPRMSARELVGEPLELHRPELDGASRDALVLEMLAGVGLSAEFADRFPHELSGGQCQRVAIARAMILEPRLLACDEPVSALDLSLRAQILALIDTLRRRSGTAVLLVSHDLAVVRALCEHVLVLYLGRAMEYAPAAALFASALHPYTRALFSAAPVANPRAQRARLARVLAGEPPSPLEPPSGCVFRTRCPHALALCAEVVPRWEALGGGRYVACHRWKELAPEPVASEPWPASQAID
jgi:peptide/nickel transport system ATP-binding protein